jgi:hypothetical protein
MSIRTRAAILGSALSAAALLCGSPAARGQLIEHLPLDGDANAAVGTSGTLAGTPTPTPAPDRNGTASGALSFASSSGGEGGRVEVPGGGGLAGLETGTIAFFVKWTGPQDAACCGGQFGSVTARQGNGMFSNQIIGLDAASPSTAHVKVNLYSAGDTAVTGSTVVGDGAWHHVALAYASGSQQLYLDGNLDGSGTAAGSINVSTAVPLTLGAWAGDGAGYSTSMMDDFRVYDRVLTQSEVQALIPEPGSFTLLALGGLAVGVRGRRRQS